MESKGSKSVAIAGSKSLPAVEFPEGFSLSVNPSHYSNTEKSIKIMEEIVIPYLERERKKHDLPVDYPTILIMEAR